MIDFYQALKDKPHLKLQIRADEAIDGLLIRILNKTTGMGLNTGFTQEEMKQSRIRTEVKLIDLIEEMK